MKKILKLLITTILSLNLYVTNLSANAEEHLAQHGVTISFARDFIMNNVSDPSYVYQICKEFGVTNDMIAEILASDYPGLTGEGVLGFFTLNGLDGDALKSNDGINSITGTWTGTSYAYALENPSIYCRWNNTIIINSDYTVNITSLLSSHANDYGQCISSVTEGTVSNVTDSSLEFNVTSTSADFIFGGNGYTFSINNNQMLESKNFYFDGYVAKRETTLSRQ